MGSHSSKFRKQLQSGNEYAALDQYHHSSDLRKALDPNSSYGDTYQHDTPMHYASRHAMKILLRIFLYECGGNPNKCNSRNETSLHCVCIADNGLTFSQLQRRKTDAQRYDCLTLILQWQSSATRDGEVEKVDMAAIDEKGNTALHYAAASGLQRCVKLLVSQGAPLFIENAEKRTPCDCAEKNNHADIALYLESKMVFSNDSSADDLELPAIDIEEGFSGLRAQDLQEAKDQLLVETSDMLRVPLFTAEALLRNHEWSRETLLEAWMDDSFACCEKCGVMPPNSLYDEQADAPHDTHTLTTRHTLPSAADTICDICACDIPVCEDPVSMACEHQFCRDCWKRYLTGKITEGDAHHLTCPGYNCTILVPVDLIETLVSKDVARRYLQFDIKAFVDSNPSIKWCPYPGCGRAVRLPDDTHPLSPAIRESTSSATSTNTDMSHAVDCGQGHVFCWECLGEAHEPASCEHWKKWQQEIVEIKPEELTGTDEALESTANCLWLITNSKPCPNCKSPIQKNEGCNHMKCSKCKHDFCWVCMEGWKKHSSVTGGYFRCNRYEVVKKVDETHDKHKTDAEQKNKKMQELNKFVHYYTRFKNHENSCKLEDPLLGTAKDKMLVLARAVVPGDSSSDVTATNNETKFVEDAVLQLMKARRVLKCSYVYGYYLEEGGYKKPIFEFMQTELEESTEALSEMIARPYLRTPRVKIMQTARLVQRKRHEFVSAIAKGLIPADNSPNMKKRRKKIALDFDEDLNKALLASLKDPSKAWIKDQSGKHTNLTAVLDWPDSDSDSETPNTPTHTQGSVGGAGGQPPLHPPHANSGSQTSCGSVNSNSDLSISDKDSVFAPGLCLRKGCTRLQVKNPRTGVYHDYCSIRCMHKHQRKSADLERALEESYYSYDLDISRAIEMSKLEFSRDMGQLQPDNDRRSTSSVPGAPCPTPVSSTSGVDTLSAPATGDGSSATSTNGAPMVLLYPPRGRSPCLVMPKELPHPNPVNYETELERALEMSKAASQGITTSKEEQDLRLAIELSLRDARISQSCSETLLVGTNQGANPPSMPSSVLHAHDPCSEEYSSVVNRVPNKSVENLYHTAPLSDAQNSSPRQRPASTSSAYSAYSTMKDTNSRNANVRGPDADKTGHFQHKILTQIGSLPGDDNLFELRSSSNTTPGDDNRGDTSPTTANSYDTNIDSESPNQYEHYFFGPVSGSPQVTGGLDDDPGPQLDAVLRTLSKLTTRLDSAADHDDTEEEEDSFLDSLLHGNASGCPPLAAGEDDSNDTSSPAGGSLPPPELEHDSAAHHSVLSPRRHRSGNTESVVATSSSGGVATSSSGGVATSSSGDDHEAHSVTTNDRPGDNKDDDQPVFV